MMTLKANVTNPTRKHESHTRNLPTCLPTYLPNLPSLSPFLPSFLPPSFPPSLPSFPPSLYLKSINQSILLHLNPFRSFAMASLNTSTHGPSIKSSYAGVVNSPAPSGPAANSPTYGQWALFSVSAPLVNAFQQDTAAKESVLKVQSTGGMRGLVRRYPPIKSIYQSTELR
jgi:hypothetical protein